jgi:protein SCO1/2
MRRRDVKRREARGGPWLALACHVLLAGCVPPTASPGAVEAPRAIGSLLDHPWSWTDDRGAAVRFSDWRGRPIVLAAVYTSCTRTCPRTLGALRQLASRLARDRSDAEFVIVTLDPATDTEERLRDFKRSSGLPDAWHLVRGSEAATAGVADLLDIHVLSMDAHVMHDSRIAVFDTRGALSSRFDCCDFTEDAAAAVARAR